VNPFDGWGTTDLIDGIPNAMAYTTASQAQLVWGSERPELLITETLAWHDIATEDLSSESPNSGQQAADSSDAANEPNAEFDQLVRPHGAALIEIYNPWPSNPAANADTHDMATGTDLGVNLSAFAVDTADPTRNSPVWRMMMYRVDGVDRDPDSPDTAVRPTTPDRSVYFTTDAQVLGTNLQNLDPNDGVAFFATLPVQSVRPGRYMVVGSGRETTTGVYETQIARERTPNPVANRRVVLNTTSVNSVQFLDETGLVSEEPNVGDANGLIRMESPADPDDASRSLADVAIINEPQRFTLSEPAEGYPLNYPPGNPSLRWYEPDDPGVSQAVSDQHPDGFYGTSPSTSKAVDTPLDMPGGPWDRSDGLIIQTPGTLPDFRTIYLQRLANPLLPWHPDTNPYLTVDVSTSNLTVFNSRSPMPTNQNAGREFFSVERGWKNDPSNLMTATNTQNNLWGRENSLNPTNLADRMAIPGAATEQRPILRSGANFPMQNIPDCTIGFLNRSFMDSNPADLTLRQIQPDQPFPWMNWNNRPYISAAELMQVPTVRSSQLLSAFAMEGSAGPQEVYTGSTNTVNPNLETDGRFGHLANFFRHDNTQGIAGLYRVLEYLHVPSRFVGTETWLNPAAFGQSVSNTSDPRMNRQPPFNRISSYRDPGRVNLNTMANENVYFGLMHGDPLGGGTAHQGPAWDALVDSRRGYGTTQPALQLLDSAPTFFQNPFRSSGAGEMVPLPTMTTAAGVNCTLLREAAAGTPLFAGTNTNPYDNTNRNPYFRYQPMTRLSNLVTTRSNVYAVWVTIGFFEVEEISRVDFGTRHSITDVAIRDALYDRVHPDGFQLGQEAGNETGDITRIREFAVIDRTVPVAFEPGKNHNAERAIRLRRRID